MSLVRSRRGRTPSRSNAMSVARRSSARTPSMVTAPFVTAASPRNEPISMWSGPIVKGAARSGVPPSTVSVLLPSPSILAPWPPRKRAKSCTWGSLAALRSTVVPEASTAFGAVHATTAPRCASSSSMVSTSRMWGTLSMRQGPSASSVAARMGRAAFLLPAGWIVPLSGRPPETQNDAGIGERKLRRALRARQAFANVRRVNPVLALGLLAAAGLLATRLPPLTSRPSLHLDLAIAAGVPLVLVGLVLGPGIEFIGRPLLRALAPVSAFAIGWIGALLGARFEWRYVRRIPRAAWLLGATTATAVVVVVALGAWLLARLAPPLATVWTPHLPAVLGLAAVAAVSEPRAVTSVAQAVGLRKSASRAFERAAALETACGAVVMIVPLALHRSQLGAGNRELGWVSWIVFAAGSGVLVGLVFLSVTRLRAARGEAGLALPAGRLFGAGIV